MLVIDRVELVALHEAQQVLDFIGRHAFGLEQRLRAAHEIADIGDVSEDIVRNDEVGAPAFCGQFAAHAFGEEIAAHLDPRAHRLVSRPSGRLDTETGDAGLPDVLQQVAIVAGEFDHPARCIQAEPCDHVPDIGLRVG